MEKTFYVTTPIYYVNASPHLGHAYTTIVADVLTRYHRLMGYRTFFTTGTDEHGDKVAETAKKAGLTPQEYADKISGQFRSLWPQMDISHDYFIRTTDANHIRTVQRILRDVYDRGDIYFGQYEGLYCVGCERFYMEKELEDGKCPIHHTPPESRKESNYFFRMGNYQQWLIGHIEAHPDFIRPERYRNEILSFLRDPLEDLCISRPKSRLAWGITLPFDENYVTYVWFDALINYLTSLNYPDGADFRAFWPSAEHLIAKDILKPHGIYWPTMLKAAGIEPYQHLNVHGYWNIAHDKMSKSLGNVVNPLDLKDKYGLDQFRYFLMRDMVFGLDSSFSEEALVQRINSDLANDLGNLVSRTLSMADRYAHGEVPHPSADTAVDLSLKETAAATTKNIKASFTELGFHKALIAIWEFINTANKYIVDEEPWSLAKDEANRERLNTIIYNLLEILRIIAVMISPFMPSSSARILEQLGIEDLVNQNFEAIKNWGGLTADTKLKRGNALFPRVEAKKGQEAIPTKNKPATPSIKPEITYEEYDKIDLRAAKVLKAEAVPKSDKLLKLTVEIDGTTQIVAGMGKDYKPEEIEGKTILVVANLKPVKLMDVESHGMLLATEADGGGLTLVGFDKPPLIGSKIR